MTDQEILIDVAQKLGVDPSWLDAMINFETGGTYSPTIKNPNSSARGLIQVIDSTAKSEFAVSDSLALVNRFPTFESQMYNVVLPYLKKYMPFQNKQQLYMAVFYPAYRNKPPTTVFPESVRKANPGIVVVQDYIDYVEGRIKPGSRKINPTGALVVVAAIATMAWFWLRRG